MKTVGLTGGIGSGKSTVGRFFTNYGIPVYSADIRAKELMHHPMVMRAVKELLGIKAYSNEGILDRKYVADIVFEDAELLKKLNTIVHPKVAEDFRVWAKAQTAPYVIKEAAILFENGQYNACDYTILVTAPQKERVARVMQRDDSTDKEVLSRMDKQWPDEKKIPLADFIIPNLDLKTTEKEARKIHVKILRSLTGS